MAIKYIQEDKLQDCINQLERILLTDLSNPLPSAGIFVRLQIKTKAVMADLINQLADSNIGASIK